MYDPSYFYLSDNLYFVKGDQYWKFNTTSMAVADGYPRHINDFIGCDPSLDPVVPPSIKSPGSNSNILTHDVVLYAILMVSVFVSLMNG